MSYEVEGKVAKRGGGRERERGLLMCYNVFCQGRYLPTVKGRLPIYDAA